MEVSRVKGQCSKRSSLEKESNSIILGLFFLKAILAFEKTYIFFCFLLDQKGENSEILLFIFIFLDGQTSSRYSVCLPRL